MVTGATRSLTKASVLVRDKLAARNLRRSPGCDMARVSADVRRQELVDAAIRVMARDGVAKTTTRAIVTEADMQLGFFHYCFRSKEELLLQVIETINERNRRAVLDVVEPRRSVRETVRASIQSYWDRVEENPSEHQITYELTQYVLRQPGLEELAHRQYGQYFTAAMSFLEAVSEAARVEWTVPRPVLARYLHSMLDGVTLSWIVDRDSEQTRAVLDEVADHLHSLAKSRRASTKAGR